MENDKIWLENNGIDDKIVIDGNLLIMIPLNTNISYVTFLFLETMIVTSYQYISFL